MIINDETTTTTDQSVFSARCLYREMTGGIRTFDCNGATEIIILMYNKLNSTQPDCLVETSIECYLM